MNTNENEISTAQAQQRTQNIQSQLKNECANLSRELADIGSRAMQAERDKRTKDSVVAGCCAVLGLFMVLVPLALMLNWWWVPGVIAIGIMLLGGSIFILLIKSISAEDENIMTAAIWALNDSLGQNRFT